MISHVLIRIYVDSHVDIIFSEKGGSGEENGGGSGIRAGGDGQRIQG